MTVTLSDRSQFQAWRIQNGWHKLAPMHQELMDWISAQYDVRALDFSCETRATSKGEQQIVHVILNTADEVKRIQSSRDDQAKITERFLHYFKSPASDNNNPDPLKSNILSFVTEPFPEIIVTYRPLKDVEGKTLREMQSAEEYALLQTFESVWTLSQYVIFFYTDVQVKENQLNGTSSKIIEALGQIRRKYGLESLSYFFDSKEAFDRDYEGKWHYYWK